MEELALGCSRLRWRIRVYCRGRDGEGPFPTLFSYFLGLRDVYVHVLRHPTFAALKDAVPCVLGLEDVPCPSYASLASRKSAADIIRGCFSVDESVNNFLGVKSTATNDKDRPKNPSGSA